MVCAALRAAGRRFFGGPVLPQQQYRLRPQGQNRDVRAARHLHRPHRVPAPGPDAQTQRQGDRTARADRRHRQLRIHGGYTGLRFLPYRFSGENQQFGSVVQRQVRRKDLFHRRIRSCGQRQGATDCAI